MEAMKIYLIERDEDNVLLDAESGATMDYEGISDPGYYYETDDGWFGPFTTRQEAEQDYSENYGD